MYIERKGTKKKPLSLQKTIIQIIVVAYLVVLLLLVCMDYYLVKTYQQQVRTKQIGIVDNTIEELSNSMVFVKKTLYDIYTNNDEFIGLSHGGESGICYSRAYDLRAVVTNQMLIDDRWHAFYLFYNNNQDSLYYANSDKMPAEDASRIFQSLKQTVESEDDQQIRNWTSMCIEGNIYLLMGMRKGEATIYGLINLSTMENRINESVSSSMQLCILDKGREIGKTEIAKQLQLEKTVNESEGLINTIKENYFIHGLKLDGSNIWAVGIYPITWKDYINLFQVILIFLTLSSCFVAAYVHRFLKINMVQSLDDLRLKMEAIRRNSNNRFLKVNARFAEFQEINETLDVMVEELEQQKLKTYEEYIEKQKAQMQFLQLQMKPHFYLNGLKALNALVLTGQIQNVQNLIYSLSEHFRYLLHQENETTRLEKEIEFTKNYCNIMDQMTGRRIQTEFRVNDSQMDFQVPVLSLQTFAENSIKYAKIGSARSVLKIEVDIVCLDTEDGKYLDVTVSDNGSGYDQRILDAINERQIDGKIHIGIDNLKMRCRILYGDRAEFTFANKNGACSEFFIPEYTENQLENVLREESANGSIISG